CPVSECMSSNAGNVGTITARTAATSISDGVRLVTAASQASRSDRYPPTLLSSADGFRRTSPMSDESDNRLVTSSNPPLSLAEREELAILLSPWTIRASKDLERLAYLSARCEPAADASLLQALLAQYNTLRLESQNSINNRIIVLSYGLVALGTLAGGA